jgi:hypothetical protein
MLLNVLHVTNRIVSFTLNARMSLFALCVVGSCFIGCSNLNHDLLLKQTLQ